MPSPNDAPTSCKISEKTIERFLRKRVPDARTDGRTDGRTGPILYVPRFTTGDQKELYSFIVLVVLALIAPSCGDSLIIYY